MKRLIKELKFSEVIPELEQAESAFRAAKRRFLFKQFPMFLINGSLFIEQGFLNITSYTG